LSNDGDSGSLANALKNAKLKRNNKSAECSSSSSSSSNSSTYGTIGRGPAERPAIGGIGISMMDEMAKTLARRRAAAEKQDTPVNPSQQQQEDSLEKKVSVTGRMNGGVTLSANGGDSPRSDRKRSGSSSEDQGQQNNRVSSSGLSDGPLQDFDALKEELIREMRKEMNKMKQEIIEVIRQEFSRR